MSAAASINGLTFFTDRTAFNGVCANLPVEDFEESTLGPGGAVAIGRPLDATSSNPWISPGDILPGLSITTIGPSRPGFELALTSSPFGGTTSDQVYANDIDIFGTSGLIGSTTAPGTPAGVFWGVRANQVITQIRILSTTNQAEGVDNVAFGQCIIFVDIDIKPGSDPNSVNCNNPREVMAVAILTTDDFDATTVDHTTVTFEGAGETHIDKKTGLPRRHEEDVDGDGDIDLVFHFRLGDTGLDCASTEGTLSGATSGGQSIEGTDAVRMIDVP
jgi:hypothetical protein